MYIIIDRLENKRNTSALVATSAKATYQRLHWNHYTSLLLMKYGPQSDTIAARQNDSMSTISNRKQHLVNDSR